MTSFASGLGFFIGRSIRLSFISLILYMSLFLFALVYYKAKNHESLLDSVVRSVCIVDMH